MKTQAVQHCNSGAGCKRGGCVGCQTHERGSVSVSPTPGCSAMPYQSCEAAATEDATRVVHEVAPHQPRSRCSRGGVSVSPTPGCSPPACPVMKVVLYRETFYSMNNRRLALYRLWELLGHRRDAGLRRNEVTYTSAIRACASDGMQAAHDGLHVASPANSTTCLRP